MAEFSNVSTTGTGSWQNVSIGVTQWSNGAAPLYVTVEDKAGKSKTATSADASATTASDWAEWRIPLSDLVGVNLAAVKKLTVGVGRGQLKAVLRACCTLTISCSAAQTPGS
jgi:hypothetical protein